MKSQKLLLLSLSLGLIGPSAAFAADIIPTQFKAFEDDLARPELKLDNEYSSRFGINFIEGHTYALHPGSEKTEDASSIRREVNASLRLPFNLETGLALYDSQQATSDRIDAMYGDAAHKKQKLGGAIWARYHLISSELLNASVVLQFEPGTADSRSFHQPSQDKKGIAFQLDGSPFAYTQAGFFLGATRRDDEKFRGSRLNDELLYGARVSVGIPSIQVFGESQLRGLPWQTPEGKTTTESSLTHNLGLSTLYDSLSFEASVVIPSSKASIGMPERGFKIGVQMVLGGRKPSAADLESSASPVEPKAQIQSDKASSSSPAPQPSDAGAAIKAEPEAFKSEVKEEGLGKIPVFQDNIPKGRTDSKDYEVLTAPGRDEFEKLDEQNARESKRPETATERAEREYRAQVADEKKLESAKGKQAKTANELEQERLLKAMEKDEKEALKSAAEIERELNEYTLPGGDETGWKGLTK